MGMVEARHSPHPENTMSLKFKKPAFVALGLIALLSALWLDFYLPEHTIATITGVEVKRTDKDGPISQKNPADGPHRGCLLHLYRAPPARRSGYSATRIPSGAGLRFKFNAADVQAKAKSMEFEKRPGHDHLLRLAGEHVLPLPNVTKIRRARCLHLELLPLVLVRRLGPGDGQAAIATWRYFDRLEDEI